ncbi:MAG: hypothetical protein P8103_16175 [Candidatus Thiodiazotropha sp.]
MVSAIVVAILDPIVAFAVRPLDRQAVFCEVEQERVRAMTLFNSDIPLFLNGESI